MEFERIKGLAKTIQKNFRNFYLAGGTALVMKYKQGISEDLDFFSNKAFSFLRLSAKLRKILKVEREERFEDNIDFLIEGIKVSIIFSLFENIKPLESLEGIKVASDYDIFLNKIYSARRRIESKDDVDFAFLYQLYRWDKYSVKKDFEKKFPDQSFEIYLGAILSTEDYHDLNKKTLEILKEVEREWIK